MLNYLIVARKLIFAIFAIIADFKKLRTHEKSQFLKITKKKKEKKKKGIFPFYCFLS